MSPVTHDDVRMIAVLLTGIFAAVLILVIVLTLGLAEIRDAIKDLAR